jgi:HK97 gp10 family phage protein
MITISITGVDQLDRVFKGLPGQLQQSFLAQVHTLAAQPFIERAKLLAPLGETGNLTKSVGIEKQNDSQGTVLAGVRRGRFGGNHGHLVEYGTVRRATKKGANRGRMPAKPFTEPAFNQTKEQVERIISYQLSKKIVDYIKSNVRG